MARVRRDANAKNLRWEVSGESLFDNIADCLTYAGDSVSDRQAPYSVASFPEGYLRHGFRVHLHVFNKALVDNTGFCAIYEKAGVVQPDQAHQVPHRHLGASSGFSEYKHGAFGSGNLNETVLVGVIQLMKKPESVPIGVRSVIRLQPLNECFLFVRDAPMNHGFSMPHVAGATFSLLDEKDWELRFGSMESAGVNPVEDHKLPDNAIKSRPQIMSDLANDDAPFDGRWLGDFRPERVVVGIDVALTYDNTVFVLLNERFGFRPEFLQVFVSAENLGGRPIKRMRHALHCNH